MDAVIHAVNLIARLSGAQVDRGFGQGYEVIRKQFELLVGEPLSDLYRGCINKTLHLPTLLYLSDISSFFAKYTALSQ